MKNLIIVTLVFSGIFFPRLLLAESKYNPWTNQWETRSSDDVIKYNPYNNSWNYEDKGSNLEYNSWTNSWDYSE